MHDEHIGKRGAVHLFRLSYEAELAVFERLRENERQPKARVITVPKERLVRYQSFSSWPLRLKKAMKVQSL